MKKTFFLIMIALICVLITNNVTAQMRLINEVETDNPGVGEDACEYVELRGTPGDVLPANTYFIAINGAEAIEPEFGVVYYTGNVSNVAFGANGLIVILRTGFTCPGRTYGTATIVNAPMGEFLQNATSSYFLLTLPAGAPAPSTFFTDYD